MAVRLEGAALNDRDASGESIVDADLLILLNAHTESVQFTIPAALSDGTWMLEISTSDLHKKEIAPGAVLDMPGRSIALFAHGNPPAEVAAP